MAAAAITNAKQRLYVRASFALLALVWGIWALRVFFWAGDLTNSDFAHSPPSLDPSPSDTTPAVSNATTSDRPLILYAYYETENARPNLEFFIAHGLHAAADFLFILNGDNTAEGILPKAPNIRYLHRQNECYDLGAFAEVLRKDDLYKRYNRFITMNASIRGPLFPTWSDACWSDRYLSKLNDEVKLVGMTYNCEANSHHVQSMIWATDRVAMEILLFPTDEQVEALKASIPPHDYNGPVPPMTNPGISSCPSQYWDAVAVEVYATPLIRAAGYQVDSMMAAQHSGGDYDKICEGVRDVLYEGNYYGMTIHPYETIFTKTNRDANALPIKLLSEWADGRKYSSYDYCH